MAFASSLPLGVKVVPERVGRLVASDGYTSNTEEAAFVVIFIVIL